jgi:hypothetical protein
VALETFVGDMQRAGATLAALGGEPGKVVLRFGCIQLDMDADGQPDRSELLWRLFAKLQPRTGIDEKTLAEQGEVAFDAADALWLRAYSSLLVAMAEFVLAHDWRLSFDQTFHLFFPRAGLPGQSLASDRDSLIVEIADIAAFVHLFRWPVADRERLRRVPLHLARDHADLRRRLPSLCDLAELTPAHVGEPLATAAPSRPSKRGPYQA